MIDQATILCNLPQSGSVDIVVYDMRGSIIMKESRAKVPAGEYKVNINRNDMKAGIYLYSVLINGEKTTGKFIVQ
ncbi:MAG: hypothetical protein CVU05_09940 [Bacteroidetes bacterium HGW-Bacteroidetes-21]|nr:MAG: hypothetical protein CVU05_09940 [Bacteroidetes bacterium HGW-Bacteroidetes-21]